MSDLSALKPDLGRCGVWTALVGPPTEWITPQQAMDIERLGYRALWVEPSAGEADKLLDCGPHADSSPWGVERVVAGCDEAARQLCACRKPLCPLRRRHASKCLGVLGRAPSTRPRVWQ